MMKNIVKTSVLLLLACSCVEKLSLPAEPEIRSGEVCLMTAEMADDATFVWSARDSKIGVYSDSGANSCWSVRTAYDGKSGEAEIFGPAASGEKFAYFPYVEDGYALCGEGRVSVPAQQKWYPSFEEHISGNMPYLVAAKENGKFIFRSTCGAMHIKVAVDFPGNVLSVSLTSSSEICGDLAVSENVSERLVNAGKAIEVTGIDRPASVSSPLNVWIMLPPGTYSGLFLSIVGESESITALLEGSVTVKAGEEYEAEAKEQYHDYGGNDFESEEVEFD